MNESKLDTIEQTREFLNGSPDVAFSIPTDESEAKGLRGVVFAYMQRLTGY